MLDRYSEIKSKLIDIANMDENISAIVTIGSSTRKDVVCDEYSDLDVIIATEDVDAWLYGDKPAELGDIKISFVEPTLGGGKERRIYLNNYLDLDILVFTKEQFIDTIYKGEATWVMNRGYEVLYDAMDYTNLLEKHVDKNVCVKNLTEKEYLNLVNDFYFHTIWAMKKLKRGEIWSAKMCVDAYLKNYLLKMIEMYSANQHGVDVWHDGRFVDTWADKETKEALKGCFAHYEKDDIKNALKETEILFSKLAKRVAELLDYSYPREAASYAREYINRA